MVIILIERRIKTVEKLLRPKKLITYEVESSLQPKYFYKPNTAYEKAIRSSI
jgi:hypothetical protein